MLYFDLNAGAWVGRPGSETPPVMVPVLTVGATYQIEVSFVRGSDVENVLGGTFYGGVKLKGDYSGTILADDAAPVQNGEESIIFSIDLTTTDAKAYFTENPTEDTVSAVFVVAATISDYEFKTPPFEIVLQNDYLTEQ